MDWPWSRMTNLSAAGDLANWRPILEHADELAEFESLDNGKPRTVAPVADVPLAADLFHYMAGWATKIEGNTIDISVPYAPGANFTRTPCGSRSAWSANDPLELPAADGGMEARPGADHGQLVVLKPAEQTPLSALRLAELIAEAGVPDGVVNVVTGFGETAGAALAAHDDVDKVAFTGSTEVGKLIVDAAAQQPQESYPGAGREEPEHRVRGRRGRRDRRRRQCHLLQPRPVLRAGSRLLVHQRRFDEVIDGVTEIAKSIKLGPGMEPAPRWARWCPRSSSSGSPVTSIRPGRGRHRVPAAAGSVTGAFSSSRP